MPVYKETFCKTVRNVGELNKAVADLELIARFNAETACGAVPLSAGRSL